MRKYQYKLLILTVLAFLSTANEIKAQFKADVQLRSRFEIRDGYQKLMVHEVQPTILESQRTRISFSYETEKLKMKITPQDVRIWGDETSASATGVMGDNASVEMFEAYAEVKMCKNSWVSVGRQQLVYDSRRLLGDRNWNQSGISYDAVILKFKPAKFNLHIGGSWNTLTDALNQNYYPAARIKSLNFIWLNRKFSDNLEASLLHISSGMTPKDSTNLLYFRHTTGLYVKHTSEKLNCWANIYYQYGVNKKGKKVSAYLADADVSYSLGKITPGIGISYLSGNKTNPVTSTDNLFDVLYGNRHTYFGYMDYFRNFSTDTKEGGLADYFVYLDYKINKMLSIRNYGHYFQLAQVNSKTPDNKNLGYENDLICKYKFSDWGILEAGYLFFLPTAGLKKIQGITNDKFSEFFYLQLTLTPTLFKQTDK